MAGQYKLINGLSADQRLHESATRISLRQLEFEEPDLIGEWHCVLTTELDTAGTPIKACEGPI